MFGTVLVAAKKLLLINSMRKLVVVHSEPQKSDTESRPKAYTGPTWRIMGLASEDFGPMSPAILI